MRRLSKKQKDFLDRECPNATCFSDLTADQIEVLTEMNDHETLWSNASRYLNDRFFKGRIAV